MADTPGTATSSVAANVPDGGSTSMDFVAHFLDDTMSILRNLSRADVDAVARELAAVRARGGRLGRRGRVRCERIQQRRRAQPADAKGGGAAHEVAAADRALRVIAVQRHQTIVGMIRGLGTHGRTPSCDIRTHPGRTSLSRFRVFRG